MIINWFCSPALADSPFVCACVCTCVYMCGSVTSWKFWFHVLHYALHTRDSICMTNCRSIWHGVLTSCTSRYFQGTVSEEVKRGSTDDFSPQATLLENATVRHKMVLVQS